MGVGHVARIIEVCFWALVIAALGLAWGAAVQDDATYYVAALSGLAVSAFGVRAFLGHGSGRITALGLFNLSTALFVGFGAIYAGAVQTSIAPPNYLVAATLGSLVPQIAITIFGWGKAGKVAPQFPNIRSSRWLTWAGILALCGAATFRLLDASIEAGSYIEATAFAAITVSTIGLIWRSSARLLSWATIFIGGLVILYAEVFHIGSGRLRIVALVCTVAVIMTARFQRPSLKWLMVIAIGPALYWLAQDRKALQESLRAGASTGRNGLESMLEPIQVFARLIQASVESGFPPSYGWNLLSYPFVWFPETWFPGAPRALGYELVKLTAPHRYGSGYSVVATSNGEAYYNFGILGLVLMVPAVVYLLQLLDRALVSSMSKPQAGTMALLGIAFWAMLAGGISDLTWSGQHTFLTRATARLPLVGVLALMAWIHFALSRNQLAQKPRISPVEQADKHHASY